MTLVKPVVSASLFVLIASEATQCGYTTLDEIAREMPDPNGADNLARLAESVTEITKAIKRSFFIADGETQQAVARCLQRRLMAAHLLESLCFVKVNKLAEAKQAYNKAIDIYESNSKDLPVRACFEAIGTVSVCVQLLERKLSRYRSSCF